MGAPSTIAHISLSDQLNGPNQHVSAEERQIISNIEHVAIDIVNKTDEIETKVNQNIIDITTLEVDVTTLGQGLVDFPSHIDFDALATTVTTHTSEIATLETEVADRAQQSEVDILSGAVTSFTTNLNNVDTRLSDEITVVDNKVDDLTTSTTTSIQSITGTLIPGLSADVSTIQTELGVTNTKVVDNTTDITGLTTKVDTNTSDISTGPGNSILP